MSWSRYFDLFYFLYAVFKVHARCDGCGHIKNRKVLEACFHKLFCFFDVSAFMPRSRELVLEIGTQPFITFDWCFISHQKPELSFKPLITGKTSVIINSTALLYGLAVISCCSSLPVSMINFSRQRICLFLFCSWQPPALPHRLQCSTIGRLSLNHRVRDGYGCGP